MNTAIPSNVPSTGWSRISLEQAELLVDYLKRTAEPDADFVRRHAMTIFQAAAMDQLIDAEEEDAL